MGSPTPIERITASLPKETLLLVSILNASFTDTTSHAPPDQIF